MIWYNINISKKGEIKMLGEKIKLYRENKKMTQNEIADNFL